MSAPPLDSVTDIILSLKRLVEQGRFEEALTGFLRIRDISPPPGVDPDICYCLFSLCMYDVALKHLLIVIHTSPNRNNASLWRILGKLLLSERRDLLGAAYAWKKALEIDPSLSAKYDISVHEEWSRGFHLGFIPRLLYLDEKSGDFMSTVPFATVNTDRTFYVSMSGSHFHVTSYCTRSKSSSSSKPITVSELEARAKGFAPCECVNDSDR